MFEQSAQFERLYEGNGLHVSKILHKAVIDVNENGTTAAAATAVLIDIRGGFEIVTVDRPFLFLLKSPEHIFFIGRVVDPKYE